MDFEQSFNNSSRCYCEINAQTNVFEITDDIEIAKYSTYLLNKYFKLFGIERGCEALWNSEGMNALIAI